VLDDLDEDGVRAALRERFADTGWEVPRILDGFATADDLYVDYLRQVKCPTWSRGRTVLLGDAAWCVTHFESPDARADSTVRQPSERPNASTALAVKSIAGSTVCQAPTSSR
jgi:hypothetical protein